MLEEFKQITSLDFLQFYYISFMSLHSFTTILFVCFSESIIINNLFSTSTESRYYNIVVICKASRFHLIKQRMSELSAIVSLI